jgi:tetratricopeptide (TPR) repeat protein
MIMFLPSMGYGFSATSQVDQTRIGPQETVSFLITVDGGEGEVDLTPLIDFQILSSGTQSSRSYVNGKWKHHVIYQYILMPKKSGVLEIPALTVVREKEKTKTQGIKILVSEADPGQGSRSFFAKASMSSPEIVLGQQAVYTLKLYSAQAFAGASFDPPGFEGLAANELTQWKKYTQNIKGQTFMVNEIKFLVQGESIGTFDIEPAVFVAQKKVSRSRRRSAFDSIFDDPFFNTSPTKPVKVVSNRVPLTVVPLPEYSGDTPFSGLVGQFTMGMTLDKNQIKVGESATLTITIQGVGNIMDAGVPSLNLDAERFKVYEDSPKEYIQATEDGFAGKKVFKQALVPNIPGDVSIPSLSLPFFDVESGSYKTISTDPIPLKVMPGAPLTLVESDSAISPSKGEAGGTGEKHEVRMKNRDILDIKEEISSISSRTHLSLSWFLILVILPGLGFGCLTLVIQLKAREKTLQERYREKARKLLAKAEDTSPGDPGFLAHLQAALTAAILALGDKQAESLTQDEIKEILGKTVEDGPVTKEIIRTMETLDAARFGGAAVDEKTALHCLSSARTFIKNFMVLSCLVFVPFFPAPGHGADSAGLFIDGTRAYQSGDYPLAVEKFEAVAALGVENPALFYNLGNAYLKSKDLGRAILWYERAKRISPGDPDLRFNLAHAQTQVKDQIDKAFSPWDILFFWQGLISLKWLQLLSIAGSFLFFSWAGIQRVMKKKVFSSIGIVIFLFLCTFLSASGLEAFRLNSDHRAIILAQTAPVRSGTMETATPLFDLHAGTRVQVMEKKKNHLKIRFSKGKVGWISKDEAEII